MIIFWIAAALLSAAAAALVVHFAGRGPQAAAADPAAAVYRRQLDEIDELADRGLLAEEERQAAHAEAARRLLSTSEAAPAEAAPSKRSGLWVLGGAIATAAVAMVVYLFVGAPGQGDTPFKRRAAEWEEAVRSDPSQLDAERLAVVLEKVVAENPDNPEPLFYLARAQIESGNLQLGVHNLKKVAAMVPANAEVWSMLGEALVLATRKDEITPEANAAFKRALELEPNGVRPRYFLARAKIAAGDIKGGLAEWRQILAGMAPDDPNREGFEFEIARVERFGSLEIPGGESGPPTEMIEQMVAGLAERLKKEPDDPEGWARLVRSYTVIGDFTKRDEALAEARRVFKERPDDLAKIEQAAEVPE